MSEFRVRRMTPADLQQVVLIDWMSFNLPWPVSAFQHEIANPQARCWVVETAPAAPLAYRSPVEIAMPNVTVPAGQAAVVAALVLWLVIDEAHIATLATHPEYRRRGLSEMLLRASLEDAARLGAELAHLEVRAGNGAAQKLYEKFGFEVVGRRKGYYKDNSEDALLMTLSHLSVVPLPRESLTGPTS
jgi:ribosomal-protein-alanine N-acetyltransferase